MPIARMRLEAGTPFKLHRVVAKEVIQCMHCIIKRCGKQQLLERFEGCSQENPMVVESTEGAMT